MHPGFLDFVTHLPPDEAANRRNLYLWETGSASAPEPSPALMAWAMFLPHEGSFDLFVHPVVHGTPAHERVMDEYVAWAEARAREAGLKSLWPFWAMEDDVVLARLMQARGFQITQADPAPPLFERALDDTDLPAVRLPAGFTLQGVHNPDAGRERARVTHAAFRVKADWETYCDEYARFRASPVYDGERDLLVRAPDGRGAAACTLWYDRVNRVGLFEPVATHPDFQRLGLGKAVMAEGLRRMRAAGMRRAQLGFDPNNQAARALYTALGFEPACYFIVAHRAV
jgi:GNAT superfamily N-acetyltransferase